MSNTYKKIREVNQLLDNTVGWTWLFGWHL